MKICAQIKALWYCSLLVCSMQATLDQAFLQKNLNNQTQLVVSAIENAGLGDKLKELVSLQTQLNATFDQTYVALLKQYKQAQLKYCLKKLGPPTSTQIEAIKKQQESIEKQKSALYTSDQIGLLSDKRDLLEKSLQKTIEAYALTKPKNEQEKKQRQMKLAQITNKIDKITEKLEAILPSESVTKLVYFNTQLRDLALELKLLTARESGIADELLHKINDYQHQQNTQTQARQNNLMAQYMKKMAHLAESIKNAYVAMPDGSKQPLEQYFKAFDDYAIQPQNACVPYFAKNDLFIILIDLAISLRDH